jgi:MFS family permease
MSAAATGREREGVHRRSLRVLFTAQIFAGAGLGAGVTTGALLAKEMIGSTSSAGVPAALFTLGGATASLLVGRLSHRSGRRAGLAAGYATGAVGGAGVILAAAIGSVALLLPFLFLYGSGVATNLQARYAGADLARPERRARALGAVLLATTLGGFVGPNLAGPTGRLALDLGLPELAGPFILSSAAYGVAAIVVAALLRPDPLLVARSLAPAAEQLPANPEISLHGVRTLRLAAVAMLISQLVMVGIMTMTPVYMRDHDHGLGATGLVISIHITAMFLPSLFSGMLVDRFGRRPVLAAGAVTLLAAGLLAATGPAHSVAVLAVALGLLGVGWNLGLVAGTAMVTDAAPLATRAKTQGNVDLVVSLAGAAGGMSSGVVVAATSYAVLSVAGGLLGLALLPLLIAARPRPRPPAAPVALERPGG